MSLAIAKPALTKLAQLFPGLNFPESISNIFVRDITLDSRNVTRDAVFFAVKGLTTDRELFVSSALSAGACAVVVEGAVESWRYANEQKRAVVISLKNLKSRIGDIAATFFGAPSKKLHLVGITGTNGKTSCTDYLFQLWRFMGIKAASLGTLGWRYLDGDYSPTGLTTLDAIENQRMLSRFVESGVTHVVMEVSSHGIDQGRINALDFDVGALTNITRDHLDYHDSFEDYTQTKIRFIREWPKASVVNTDDVFGRRFYESDLEEKYICGCSIRSSDANVYVCDLRKTQKGFEFFLMTQNQKLQSQVNLIGEFNLSNVLVVIGIQLALGYPPQVFVPLLPKITAAPGRLQCVDNVYIDYAHTPDALKQVLSALKAHCDGRLIIVFGCGGDRDRGKRPMMATIAEQLADMVIVTSDNPRFESQDLITQDICAGFSPSYFYEIIPDRASAIQKAVSIASENDIVLIAGKGHEDYQDVCGEKTPFSDIEEVKRAVA